MLYREYEPTGTARSFIKCYWLLDDPSPSPEPQRLFPDGRPELIFNLAGPFESKSNDSWRKQPQSFVVGQITGPMVIRPCGPAMILGVRLHAYGANRIFKEPSAELTGNVVALSDIDSPLRELTDRLHDCRSPGDRVRIVEEAVVHQSANNSRAHDPAIAFAANEFERTRGLASIAEVAHQLGISLRQFQRRFVAAVGIGPKLFCRMQRFQLVVRAMGQPDHDWTDIAIGAGYFDQAHLIRDFRQFTGTTPRALVETELKLNKLFA